LRNSEFRYQSVGQKEHDLRISEIRMRIDNFRFSRDSLHLNIFSMSMNDGQGFYLNELSAQVRQVGNDFFISQLRL
jgi:hypothetical protein